ncbi:MAG: glycosyltransferase, partial [Candidatus Methanosuratincola petrocarbonis]
DRVSDEKLKTYYRMADIYVQPSTGEEGWGITITEAYRYRLPVVCTRIFAKTGVADEDRAIVVKEGDPDQLAKAIETLIEDNATRERISERGNIFAKDLSWEKMSREILQIIEETRRSNHPNNR